MAHLDSTTILHGHRGTDAYAVAQSMLAGIATRLLSADAVQNSISSVKLRPYALYAQTLSHLKNQRPITLRSLAEEGSSASRSYVIGQLDSDREQQRKQRRAGNNSDGDGSQRHSCDMMQDEIVMDTASDQVFQTRDVRNYFACTILAFVLVHRVAWQIYPSPAGACSFDISSRGAGARPTSQKFDLSNLNTIRLP